MIYDENNLNRPDFEASPQRSDSSRQDQSFTGRRPSFPPFPHGMGPGGPQGMGPGGPHGMGPGGPRGMGPDEPQGGPFHGRRPPQIDREWFQKHYDNLSREDKLSFQLAHLHRLMGRVPGALFGQGKVLSILMDNGEMTQKDLTEKAGIQPGSMSEVLRKLEFGGYIRRLPDPKDHRGCLICLTEAGQVAAGEITSNARNIYDALTEEEQQSLLALLEKLEISWREKLPHPPAREIYLEKPQKA